MVECTGLEFQVLGLGARVSTYIGVLGAWLGRKGVARASTYNRVLGAWLVRKGVDSRYE